MAEEREVVLQCNECDRVHRTKVVGFMAPQKCEARGPDKYRCDGDLGTPTEAIGAAHRLGGWPAVVELVLGQPSVGWVRGTDAWL